MDNPLVRLALFCLLALVELVSIVGSAVGLYAMGVLSYTWSIVFGVVGLISAIYIMYNVYKKSFN